MAQLQKPGSTSDHDSRQRYPSLIPTSTTHRCRCRWLCCKIKLSFIVSPQCHTAVDPPWHNGSFIWRLLFAMRPMYFLQREFEADCIVFVLDLEWPPRPHKWQFWRLGTSTSTMISFLEIKGKRLKTQIVLFGVKLVPNTLTVMDFWIFMSSWLHLCLC